MSNSAHQLRPFEVKHILHKDIFHPNGERLLAFIQVSKSEPRSLSFIKKENVHYLCCSVTVKRPIKAYISRYRRPDKGDGYEERRKWSLEELAKVDGMDTSSNCLSFELHFDKMFRFECLQFNDKDEFLENLAQICNKYLQNSPIPIFENISTKVKKNLPSISDLRNQMNRNIRDVQEREHKLSELESKTSDMAESARSFSETARDLANHYRK